MNIRQFPPEVVYGFLFDEHHSERGMGDDGGELMDFITGGHYWKMSSARYIETKALAQMWLRLWKPLLTYRREGELNGDGPIFVASLPDDWYTHDADLGSYLLRTLDLSRDLLTDACLKERARVKM